VRNDRVAGKREEKERERRKKEGLRIEEELLNKQRAMGKGPNTQRRIEVAEGVIATR